MAKEKIITNLVIGDNEKGGDIIEFFNSILEEKAMSQDFEFLYQTNNKLKSLIKISKVPENVQIAIKKDIIVQFNEEYFDNFDDDTKTILIEQELDKIEVDISTGKIKVAKADLSTSKGVVHKYTFDVVEKAIEVEKLFEQQLKDKEKEEKRAKKEERNKNKF
jgi:hypothetical protein